VPAVRTPAIYRDGRFVGIDGRAIDEPALTDPVRLWHPINSTVRDVLSWRGFLEALGITQPFKQTHREIYILTDAERATLQAAPNVTLVTIPGSVFLLPDEVPQKTAAVIADALSQAT